MEHNFGELCLHSNLQKLNKYMHCKLTDENHTRGWYLMGYNYRYFCFKQKSFQPWLIMRIHDCSIHFDHRDLANKTLMYAVAWTSATSLPHGSLLKPPLLKPELYVYVSAVIQIRQYTTQTSPSEGKTAVCGSTIFALDDWGDNHWFQAIGRS